MTESERRIALDSEIDKYVHVMELELTITKLKAALTRLGDCDWVITLPDRMDAVRKIARDALSEAEKC